MKIESAISSISSLLGFLKLLTLLEINYVISNNRFWKEVIYELQMNLSIIIIILIALYTSIKIYKREYKNAIFILMPLVFSPFVNIELLISISGIIIAIDAIILQNLLYDYITYQMLNISIINLLSLLHWIIFYPLGIHTPLESVANFERELFFLFGSITPYLGLMVIFIGVYKTILHLTQNGKNMNLTKTVIPPGPLNPRQKTIIITLLIISTLASVYPYNFIINPNNIDPGIDIRSYLEHVKRVEENPINAFTVWDGSRPTIFIIIYLFQRILNLEALTVIRFVPVFLNGLLAISTYYLGLEIFEDRETAILSMFFSITGFPLSINMFSYFLANTLGLSFLFISLTFLFKAIRSNNPTELIFAYIFGVLLLFSHPWTFDQYYIPFLLTTVLIIMNPKQRFGNNSTTLVRYSVIYSMGLGLTGLVKFIASVGEEGISALFTPIEYLTTLNNFWPNIVVSFTYMFGGLYSNLILMFLIIIGILSYRPINFTENVVQISLGLSSIVFLFGNQMIKSRIFYNLPTAIFAALGFLYIYREENISDKRIFTFFVIVTMILNLFRGLAGLV